MLRCVYCGTRDIDSAKLVEGYRTMCPICLEKKEPLIVTSSKSNHKRVLTKLKKRVQVKRKINKIKDIDIVTSDSESSWQ